MVEQTFSDASISTMVSVIVPCFNQARFLADCIESLQVQSHVHWEAIIIDDGSTDDTRVVAAGLMASDPRIRYVNKANGGPSSARNLGLSLARGDWIQFLDGDDVLLPTKFERQLSALCAAQRPAVSYTDYRHGAENDVFARVKRSRMPCRFTSTVPVYELARDWEVSFSIPIHAPLVDASFFRSLGIRFDETLRNHEDWDVWMRIFSHASEIHFIAEELAVYRACEGSNSRNQRLNWLGFRMAIDRQLAYFQNRPDVLKLLRNKRCATDWAYGFGWRRRLHDWLQASRRYRANMPWPVQRRITSMLTPTPIPWPTASRDGLTVVREWGPSTGLQP